MNRRRLSRGFVGGLLVGSAPGLLLAAWAVPQNPWFLDLPFVYLFWMVLLPAVLLGLLARRIWPRPAGRERLLLLAPAQVALLAFLWPKPALDTPKLLVFGIDGATFDIIDPMIAAGELPNIARVQREGARGVLRSMDPIFSPLVWTTMASGHTPDVHGVKGFHVHATDCKVPRFWDIAAAKGLRVGTYKWLATWPPRPVPGFIVPAWLAPTPETFPSELSFVKELELQSRLKRKNVPGRRSTAALLTAGVPGGMRFSTLLESAAWKLRERLTHPDEDERNLALQRLRGHIDRDVFIHALHAYYPDLATFTWYGTDGLGHRFWAAQQPEAFPEVDAAWKVRYAEAVRDSYRWADEILGQVLDRVGPDTTVMIVSDHGFRAFDKDRDIPAVTPTTEALRARLMPQFPGVQVARLGIKVTVTVEPNQLDALDAALRTLTDASGAPFYRWEIVPDIAGTLGLTVMNEHPRPEELAAGTVGGQPMTDFVHPGEAEAGEHDYEGIFLARGAGVPAGAKLPELQLIDVTPTLLALLGIPPAQDLPGRIALGPQTRGPASFNDLLPDYGAAGRSGEVNEDALRALGYIE